MCNFIKNTGMAALHKVCIFSFLMSINTNIERFSHIWYVIHTENVVGKGCTILCGDNRREIFFKKKKKKEKTRTYII